MKSIDIKGKSYVPVSERLKHFRSNYKDHKLVTEIDHMLSNEDRVVMVASILNADNEVVAMGHAFEDRESTFVNKTSFIENCETSAWGRALENLFGTGNSNIASFEEVANAISQQDDKPWLNHDEFSKQVDLLNREPDKEKRRQHANSLLERYKINKEYRNVLSELIESRDINV